MFNIKMTKVWSKLSKKYKVAYFDKKNCFKIPFETLHDN